MKTNILVIGLIAVFLGFTSCNRFDPDPEPPVCDYNVVVDAQLYEKGTSSFFTLSDVNIVEDCLTLSVTSSGCSGDSWKFKLVDSGVIAESYPVQRYMRLLLTNNELCDAVITKKVSFNLTPIRTGEHKVIIHLKNWDESLLYTY